LGNIILRFKVREKTEEIQKELAERERAEKSLAERVSLLELGGEGSKALIKESRLGFILQQCTDVLVKYLDASFARIWLLNKRRKAQFLVRDWAVLFGAEPMPITDIVSGGQSSLDSCWTGDWHPSVKSTLLISKCKLLSICNE